MQSFRMNENVTGYIFGSPVKIGIVLGDKTFQEEPQKVQVTHRGGHGFIHFDLSKRDRVYGLGVNLGGINKRGRRYVSYCTDDPLHHEDKTTLYGAHNFFIVEDDDVSTGYFIDFPSKITYDVGFRRMDEFDIEIFGEDFAVYVVEGKSLKDIVVNFHKIIGKPYVPPKWGFGFFQSRWGYETQDDVLNVYKTFRGNDIPLEGIYLDLDYMEDFKDFSVSEKRFGDFKKLSDTLKEEGVRLIPIIDAGIKIEEGYDIYEEGIKGGYFVEDEEGKPYVAAVWPGKVHFPDFLKEEVREWFGDKYKFLTDLGIEGVWNDMNEPAIFYDEKSLTEAVDTAIAAKGKNLGVFAFFDLKDKFQNMGNRDEYYRRFFHEVEGKRYTNEELHNLYGYYMTKSASLGLKKNLKKRFILISRASSIGMHKYGGIWTGDNSSWWSHLELNLKMLPSLNMSGFYYVGADTGGFGGNSNGQLLTRWMQLSIFTPLLRNHSAIGCVNQEPYAFGERVMDYNRELIKDRYMLIPYLYSEYLKNWEKGGLMFTPLSFEFRGEEALNAEDQLLMGNEIMLTPVYKPNARGRYVFLPDKMAEVTFGTKGVAMKVEEQGLRNLAYELDELKFFLRRNRLFPYVRPSANVKGLDISEMKMIGYVDEVAEYELYDDDGESFAYQEGILFKTTVRVTKTEDGYKVVAENTNPKIKRIRLTLIDSENEIMEKEVQV